MRTHAIISALLCCALASCTTDFDRFQFAGSDEQASSMDPEGDAGDASPGDASPGDASPGDASPSDASTGDAAIFDLDASISHCQLSFERFPIVNLPNNILPSSSRPVVSVGTGDLQTSTLDFVDDDDEILLDTPIDVDGDGDPDVLHYVADGESGFVYNWSEMTEVNMLVILDEPGMLATYLCDLDDDRVLGCVAQLICDSASGGGTLTGCFRPPAMPVSCGLCELLVVDDFEAWQCEGTSQVVFGF